MSEPLIDDETLAELRDIAESAHPESAQIRRPTLTSDGMGGQQRSWSVVATVTGCVLPPGQRPEERVVADRLGGIVVQTIALTAGTDVRSADQILIGAHTFEVVTPITQSYEAERLVVCKEIL